MSKNSEKDVARVSELPSINQDHECLVPDNKTLVITTKRRSVRNLVILSLVYFLYFTGFWSLSNLESTMNAEGGMGTDSQAVIYLCSMVSCFFPELLIEKFGSKTTIIATVLLSCPYIAANFHLRWDTMMISSVLYGLASGPLNAALCFYLDEMAKRYHSMSTESRENVEAFFFSFFMFWSEFTQVLGNTISTMIIDKSNHFHNSSVKFECGAHFQPWKSNITNDNLIPPSEYQRVMLTGIYLLLGILAVVVGLFIDPLQNEVKEIRGCYSVYQKFIGSIKQLKNPNQLLLLPLTIYLGFEGSFYAIDFSEAFIACSWGVHHVGFVTVCFGVCGAMMAIFIGPLVKCISQMSVILLAALLNIVTCALLFVWQPSPDVPSAYFIFAGVWGMTDAIWWSQVPALYGLMFPNDREAAFSNFYFWSFLGYFISFSYANYITVAVKINIMLAVLVIGITLYVIGQIRIKCSARSGYIPIEQSE